MADAGTCMRCAKQATVKRDAHLGVLVWTCGCGTQLLTEDRRRYLEAIRRLPKARRPRWFK